MNPPLEAKQECAGLEVKADTGISPAIRKALQHFALFTLVLSLCFSSPLLDLVRRAFQTQLYSHVVLIPFISIYLGWLRRETLPAVSARSIGFAILPTLAGIVGLLAYGAARAHGVVLAQDDALALTTASFLCFVVGGALLILGTATVRALAFPFGFLVFMIPIPVAVVHWLEMFFQHATAAVCHLFFVLSGTPVLREGTVFQLPGLDIRVAEECSGIRSSFVLFMTSLAAGCLFLQGPWKRTALALAVIPLGILRNAIRILTIALLTIHVDPNIINSPIHHKGGPFFFLLSLIPFFLLLHWLRKSEMKGAVPRRDDGRSTARKEP